MKGALEKIVGSGVYDDQTIQLKRKIKLSNYVALLISFGVALPFIFISSIYFPPNTYLPALAFIVSLLCIFLNKIRLDLLGRVIISVTPVILTAVYGANLSMIGEPAVLGIFLIQLSFSITPFLVFDLRDKAYLAGVSAVVVLFLFAHDFLDGIFETEMETGIIRSGYLADVSIFLSAFFLLGGVSVLLIENASAEKHAKKLFVKLNEERDRMESSEQDLKENLKKLEEKQEDEEKRKWANEGIAKISNILRSDGSLGETCDRLISYVVKYMKATQGGLYLVNENEEHEKLIQLQAMYAYDRKKYTDKSIRPGEGLVGQAYLEKDYIFMTDVPQDYVNITSGLGEANPNSILIMPLMSNEEVEGFIELASFDIFQDYMIRFLQEAGEGIASTVRNSRINEKTKLLLEQSQQQSEQLQAQEEEMRQNMEELEATQEENRRKSLEMEFFIQTLNNSVATIEFTPDGHILDANDNWCNTVGGKLETFKGKHHRIFVSDEYGRSEEYYNFWKRLGSGESINGEFDRVALNGKKVWLRASYTPQIDDNGRVVKVVKFAFDITDLKTEIINSSESEMESPELELLSMN